MKSKAIIAALALSVSASYLTAQEPADAPPAGDRPPPPPEGAAQAGAQQRPGGLRLLPPGLAEILKLTAEQQKQMAVLEAEVKAKLEKILTPGQLEQLKQMRPPQHPPVPRKGAPGGAGRPAGDGAPAPQDDQDNPAGQAPPPRPELEE
jgi:hypothetical protein